MSTYFLFLFLFCPPYFKLISFYLPARYKNQKIKTPSRFPPFRDDSVEVYNKIGTKLFERTFEGKKIVYANKQKIIGINRDFSYSFKAQDAISVFTSEKKKDLFYSGFQSFTDPQNKNSFLYLLKENKLISYFGNALTTTASNLSKLYYDFANIYSMGSFSNINLGDKNSNDIFFQLSHYYYMYPSALYILSKGSFSQFFNPGPLYLISHNADGNNRKLLISGTNNVFSHLYFIIELSQSRLIPNTNNPIKGFEGNYAIPTLNKDTYKDFRGLFILIPRYSLLIENRWFTKSGFLKYRNSLEKDSLITVNRNYKIIHKTAVGIREYFDSKTTLNKVYAHVNDYYKEKLLTKDYKKALALIDESLEIPIQNIWLKSSLLYFKGDLLIKLGKFVDGAIVLKESLKLYPKNTDAFQRLTEISFLRGKTEEAINIVSKAENDMSAFWGLNRVGKNLFETYCYLQNGRFLMASDKIEYSKKKFWNGLSQLYPTIRSISNVFSGNYKEALIRTNSIRGKSPLPFTLIEYRLVYARATILYSIFQSENDTSIPENYEHIKKLVRFYIKDIAVNSISSNHLAKISRAYFLAIDGQKREAERMAKDGFTEVLRISRGDFFTRLWLFYDAFIYGKTMEILGDKKEALRGYKECIKANPHTDLARRAKERVKSLKVEPKQS